MKTAWIITIIFLLAGWLTAFYFWDVCRDQELTYDLERNRVKTDIDQARHRIAQREATINDLVFKLDSATVSNKSRQAASKREIAVLRKRERGLRVDTVTMTLVDTIFAAQDSVILAVELDRDRISRECHQLADSFKTQISDLKLVVAKTDTLKQFAEADLKKERKGKKWWRRIAAAGGVVIVYLAVKND